MPAQASEESPEGAAAFVAYYVKVLNYAAATGDVEELTRLSSPDCDGCQTYIALYRDTYEAGGYFRGGDWELGELQLQFDPDETFATTDVRSNPTSYRESAESKPKEGPGSTTKISFGVRRSGAKKLVSQLALGEA